MQSTELDPMSGTITGDSLYLYINTTVKKHLEHRNCYIIKIYLCILWRFYVQCKLPNKQHLHYCSITFFRKLLYVVGLFSVWVNIVKFSTNLGLWSTVVCGSPRQTSPSTLTGFKVRNGSCILTKWWISKLAEPNITSLDPHGSNICRLGPVLLCSFPSAIFILALDLSFISFHPNRSGTEDI